MPRPKRPRTIHSPPCVEGLSPRGKRKKGEVTLSFEEFEVIRLIDFNGMDQSGAAALMGVSRQTVGRVLKSARFTLSKALVKGVPLKVTGGCYQVQGASAPQGMGRGPGHHRRHGSKSRDDQQNQLSGGNIMAEDNRQNNKQDKTDKNNQTGSRGQGQGQGRGQGRGLGQGKGRGTGTGRGQGGGGGQGSGQGRGRGLGGGKGDGSCRNR